MTTTVPNANGSAPYPPPPPPAPEPEPKKPERTISQALADRFVPRSERSKRMLALAGALVVGWVFVDHIKQPIDYAKLGVGVAVAARQEAQQMANQQPATIVRTGPLSWVGGGCAPNADALNIVGVDQNVPSTWDPVRGATVEGQVKALISQGSQLPNLRVTTDQKSGVPVNQAQLLVKDGGVDGVPLFKCTPNTTTTQPASPPPSPAPTTTQAHP